MFDMSHSGVVSSAQALGPDENHKGQEDFMVHVSHGTVRLLGILDGHGGIGVAHYCARTIPQIFDFGASDTERELCRVVGVLNDRTRRRESGATLSLVHIDEAHRIATTAVLGDSPIIVIDADGATHRSVEHNVRTNMAEREAAIARGTSYTNGYICDKGGVRFLQLSRTLGDSTFDALLDRTPEICQYGLGVHSFIIVGSDGMFDPAHDDDTDVAEQIITLARMRSNAQEILRWRESKELKDNASLIIWRPRRWWEWFV